MPIQRMRIHALARVAALLNLCLLPWSAGAAAPRGPGVGAPMAVAGALAGSAARRSDSVVVVHAFEPGAGDGSDPLGGLLIAQDGTVYGTTTLGGVHGLGTLYSISQTGQYQVLHSFARGADDGTRPEAAPTLGRDGWLYGTTSDGGRKGLGIVYRVRPDGKDYRVLHSFTGGRDGGTPRSALLLASDGNFYVLMGDGNGQMDEISPDGRVRAVHRFTDLSAPVGALAESRQRIYGTARGGGRDHVGGVFRYDLGTQRFSTAAYFTGSNGAAPLAGLMLASNGDLYGTTSAGGARSHGAVFEFTPGSDQLQAIFSFDGGRDGLLPASLPYQGPNGHLYVTASSGGPRAQGTLVRMKPDGTSASVLYSFGRTGADGSFYAPHSGVTGDPRNGFLYGTALAGGPGGKGVVYALK
jgi:uncharacterized repeat protein (TIGR03803 family)